MANVSRLEGGICAIELASPISLSEELDVYFRSGEIWYPIGGKFTDETTVIFNEGTGASFIVPAATNSESLKVVVLNKSKKSYKQKKYYISRLVFFRTI